MTASQWRGNWLWCFPHTRWPGAGILARIFLQAKSASVVCCSPPSVGRGSWESGGFFWDFWGCIFAGIVSVSLFIFLFNYPLQFFYSFIVSGSRVLSNISGAETGEMWYFRFGWVHIKRFRCLLSALAQGQSLYYMFWHFLTLPMHFQVALVVKNLPANAGGIRDAGSIPGFGRSPGWGHGNPFQYSCLENPVDRGTWQAVVHGVAKSQTWLKQPNTYTHNIAGIFRSTVQSKKNITLGFYVWRPIAWLTSRKSKILEYRDLGLKTTHVTC